MRNFFGGWGNVGLYSLGVAAMLAIGASVFFGVGILRSDGGPLERADTPTVAEQDAPKKAEGERAAEDQYQEPAAIEEEPEEETPDLAAAPSDGALSLTVPKMGRYNDPVLNDMSEATLDQGAGKLPSSGFPWEPGSNTYIAAHVLGWEGTNSWLQFANLPNMTYGDVIYLTDSAGTTYTYEVTEILNVTPYDVWVTSPEAGRDMVSLQTCVGENYEQRLIVRGDRVA
jgi:sortase A